MNRTRSIALPVAGVLILGMALIMVISTVVTLIVFLLTDNDSRQRIAVDIVGRFLIEETKDTRSGSPNSAYVPAKTIELAKGQPEFWYVVDDGIKTAKHGTVPPSAKLILDAAPSQMLTYEFSYMVGGRDYIGAKRVDESDSSVTVSVGGVSLSDTQMLICALWSVWPQGLYHLLGAVLITTAAIAFITMRRTIAAPVRRVVSSAEDIDGLPNGRRLSDHDTPKELKPMVAAFNTALSRIDNAFEAQRNFLASASHELRTPLTKLRIKLDLVQDPEVREVLVRDVTRLASIVTTSLQLARLSGQSLTFSVLDLTTLARAIVADHVPSAMKHGMEIEFNAPEERVMISGSEPAIRVALDNLIINAMRHAQGTEILTVDVLPSCTLRVSDNGPGIPAMERQKMLRPFVRGNGSTCEGTGMGLAIVSQIMAAHGGFVHLEEAAEGGLMASLAFPRSEAGT